MTKIWSHTILCSASISHIPNLHHPRSQIVWIKALHVAIRLANTTVKLPPPFRYTCALPLFPLPPTPPSTLLDRSTTWLQRKWWNGFTKRCGFRLVSKGADWQSADRRSCRWWGLIGKSSTETPMVGCTPYLQKMNCYKHSAFISGSKFVNCSVCLLGNCWSDSFLFACPKWLIWEFAYIVLFNAQVVKELGLLKAEVTIYIYILQSSQMLGKLFV